MSKVSKKNQNSILCDVCQKWSHLKCTSLSTDDFFSLASSSFPFYCYKCYKNLFPFHSLGKDDLNLIFKKKSLDNIPTTSNTTNCAITTKHVQYITSSEINTHFNNSLIIIHVNVRSLNKNFDKLYELITEMKIKPDVIGLTETWINKTRPFTNSLPGYNFIHNNSKQSHGGVGFFISNCQTYKITSNFDLNLDDCEDM